MARPKPKNTPAPKIDDRAIVDPDVFNKGEMDDDADSAEGDAEDDGDDDGDEVDDDKEEHADDTDGEANRKSEVDVGDLRKAMDALESAGKAAASGISPRATALGAKLAKGDRLSKAEADELRALTTEAAPTTTTTKDALMADPDIKEGADASSFLDALLTKAAAAIDKNTATLEKGLTGIDAFNAQLAKSFVALGREVATLRERNAKLEKSMGDMMTALNIEAEKPARPKGSTRPANRPGVDDVNKGGAIDLPAEKISNTLDEMLVKGEFPEGIDPLVEISKFESTGICRADVMDTVLKKNGIKLPAAAA